MRNMKILAWLFFVVGCAASTSNVGTLVLPTSNKSIDVVQHRSDSKECVVQVVLQTYSDKGELIDSRSAEGNALHCQALGAGIQAGGMVGAAAVLRPSNTRIDNNNEQSQAQEQSTSLKVKAESSSSSTAVNAISNSNTNNNSNNNSNVTTPPNPQRTHVNKSGGGDDTNPGGKGNDNGFNNPGKSK